jgi:hypothetical protein
MVFLMTLYTVIKSLSPFLVELAFLFKLLSHQHFLSLCGLRIEHFQYRLNNHCAARNIQSQHILSSANASSTLS